MEETIRQRLAELKAERDRYFAQDGVQQVLQQIAAYRGAILALEGLLPPDDGLSRDGSRSNGHSETVEASRG